MGRWGDGEMGRGGDGAIFFPATKLRFFATFAVIIIVNNGYSSEWYQIDRQSASGELFRGNKELSENAA